MSKINYKPTDFSAVELFMEGRAKEDEAHKNAEKSKIRTLRGGSAGMLLEDGSVLGTSPWKSLARYLGYQLPIPEHSRNIFDGGWANEALWNQYLTSRGTNFKEEEEYPLKYEIEGVTVSGRPDIVILTKKGNEAVFGVENKAVLSEGTAAKVFLEGKPKDDNFIQACHYSHKFDLPWILVYSAYAVFAPNFFTKRKFGDDDIQPQHAEFKIGCKDNKFYYLDSTGETIDTLITVEGIEDYYRAIIESAKQKDISWMRMANYDIHGVELNFDLNAYDDLCLLVNPNTSFDNWLAGVERACKQTRYIKAKKVNKALKYRVYDISSPKIVDEFDTVEEAREFIFGGDT